MKYLLILFLALSATVANGQLVTTVGQNQDLFQKNLYSADRVMELRNELDLSEAQATKIKKIHSENAGKFSTMKWDLDDETKKLKVLLDETKIDQVAVQKQMDKVLALENSLKKQQLSTMVSIKNELNPEQQEILKKNAAIVIRGVGSVNSVQSFSNSTGYAPNLKESNIKFGQAESSFNKTTWDNTTVVSGKSTSSPKVSVMVTGSDENKHPLYYIDTKDGMKEVSDLNHINPNEIESMHVLKDKSAVEKFGEKAKNGVVIIKLKEDPKK